MDIGDLKFKPLLAHTFDGTNCDYSGWLMSEKLDGVRCIFFNDKLYSRTGHLIHAPEWFIQEIRVENTKMLDGELFTKRGQFQSICSIVKKDKPIDTEWENIVYMVFDIPLERELVFSERYDKMVRIIQNHHRIQVVPHEYVQNMAHVESFLQEIINMNGEGVMLRDPHSYYEQKRSKTLVKYKKFMDDDAIITGFEYGKGKYSKSIGKFLVKWVHPSKPITFNVGSGMDDNIRNTPNPTSLIGKIIKVKYYSTTVSGKPRFPIFIGFRE